ncbi:MAG TPA: hypothetical protein VKT78_08520 [Fimbriimonadaceae bacterium]|nr:hypothetical protein [Fimbriimonadaceae bacterium]
MRWISRCFVSLVAVSVTALALGQQGAAGYGQGRGGGGMGGGGMGGAPFARGTIVTGNLPGAFTPAERRFADHLDKQLEQETPAQNLWTARSAVLTPGDRVEFKVKMRKGETVLAGVTSDAFDPALAILDSKGKELAKNDDREEGDQSPFLVYRFAEAGDYTLKVLSYRSVSGGKFEIKYRSFVAIDSAVGPADHQVDEEDSDPGNRRIYFRLTCRKGQIYDLSRVQQTAGRNQFQIGLDDIIGPTGVAHNDYSIVPTPDDQPVFKALADGDFYFEYNAAQGSRVHTSFDTVKTLKFEDTASRAIDFRPGELQLVEFPVKPSQIIRTAISGAPIIARLTAPAGKKPVQQTQYEAYGNDPSVAWFRPDIRSDNDYIRIFHGEGTAQLAIRNLRPSAVQIKLENKEGLPAWEDGKPVKGTLAIGQSKLFLVDSTKSELMHVSAVAKTFVAQIDIFRMDGELANSLSNRQTLAAADDLYFPDPDHFVIRLSCVGDGGSGDYDMVRQSLKAAPYALNHVQDLKLDGGNFGLYSVDLEAGKRYEFIYDLSDNRYMSTDLLDQDGQFLTSNRLVFGKVVVEYFIPAKSGAHRLWLRGQPGAYKFRLSPHVPPTVEGRG